MNTLEKLRDEMRNMATAAVESSKLPCTRLMSMPDKCAATFRIYQLASHWSNTLDAYIKAQGSAEPVGRVEFTGAGFASNPDRRIRLLKHGLPDGTLVYAAPPPREPITREALRKAIYASVGYDGEVHENYMLENFRALGIEITP